MKWKILLLLTNFLLMTPWCSAETIFLKSGNIIEGEIVENTGYAVRVKKDGNVQTIFGTEILRIVKEGEDLFKPTQEEKAIEEIAAEKKELISRLLEANQARENINMLFQQIISQAPKETHEELKKIFRTDEILERVIPIYDKYYTVEELKEVVNFYKSPTGNKHVKLAPIIMEETIRATYTYFKEKAEDFPNELKSP